MIIDFVKVLKEAKKFASRDRSRKNISGVHVCRYDGVLAVEATNGHVVLRHTCEEERGEANFDLLIAPGPALEALPQKSGLPITPGILKEFEVKDQYFPAIHRGIPSTYLGEILVPASKLKDFSKTPETMARVNPKTRLVRLEQKDGRTMVSVKNREVSSEFLHSHPLEEESKRMGNLESIGFNGTLLSQCMKAVTLLGEGPVKWSFSSKYGLSTMESGPTFVGIMPMRVYD